MASTLTPVRQPFGVLNDSKLRNLQSVKNRQNSIAPSKASLKRGHTSLDLSDSENVDPVDFSASKRKRGLATNDICKPSNFAPKTFAKPKSRLSASSIVASRPETPTVNTAVKPDVSWSAPTAAGRSPTKSKRPGILSNRRTRLNAPALGAHSRSTLSLAAAVKGTLADKKHKRKIDTATLEESKPKSWFFDIYEYESPELEKDAQRIWTGMEDLISLDISDDERRSARKSIEAEEKPTPEEENKENVPPNESYSVTSVKEVESRKNLMTDEPRTPLGDLNPSDYYADGFDAASVTLVGEEVAETESLTPLADSSVTSSSEFSFHSEPTATAGEDKTKPMTTSEITNLLFSVAPQPLESEETLPIVQDDYVSQKENMEPAEIEIWESGSAKDEPNEMELGDNVFAEL